MKKCMFLFTVMLMTHAITQPYVVTTINHTAADIEVQVTTGEGISKNILIRPNATDTLSFIGCPSSVTISNPTTFARSPVSLYYLDETACSDKEIHVYEATGLVTNKGTSSSGIPYRTGGFINVSCFKVVTTPSARRMNNVEEAPLDEFISQGVMPS